MIPHGMGQAWLLDDGSIAYPESATIPGPDGTTILATERRIAKPGTKKHDEWKAFAVKAPKGAVIRPAK